MVSPETGHENTRLYADLMQKYEVVPDPAARAFLTPLLTQKEARR